MVGTAPADAMDWKKKVDVCCRLLGQSPRFITEMRKRALEGGVCEVKGIKFEADVLAHVVLLWDSKQARPDDLLADPFSGSSSSTGGAASSASGQVVSDIVAAASPHGVSDAPSAPLLTDVPSGAGISETHVEVLGPKENFKQCAWAGQVGLFHDSVVGLWYIYHKQTQEVRALPAAALGYILEEDDGDMFAIEVKDGDSHIIDVADCFQSSVWQHTCSGELVLVTRANGSERRTLLAEARAKHQPSTLQVDSQLSSTQDKIECAVFDMPRAGYRAHISLPSLVEVLGLHREGLSASKYCCHAWKSMQSQVSTMEFGLGLTASRPYAKGEGVLASPDDVRTLSFKSCSCTALLFFLAKWAWASKQFGGLTKSGDREKALSLLRRLVSQVHAKDGGFSFRVFEKHDVNEIGEMVGQAAHTIMFDKEGRVYLQGWEQHAEVSPRSKVASWVSKIQTSGDATLSHVLEFLKFLVETATIRSPTKSLAQQVFHRCGAALDAYIVSCATGGDTGARVGVEVCDREVPVERQVALYVQAIADACHARPLQFLSGTFDKSNVIGFNLQNAGWALPGNLAFWSPPQAAREQIRFAGLSAFVLRVASLFWKGVTQS